MMLSMSRDVNYGEVAENYQYQRYRQ